MSRDYTDLPQIVVIVANGQVQTIAAWSRSVPAGNSLDEYNSALVLDYGELKDPDDTRRPVIKTVRAAFLTSMRWEEALLAGPSLAESHAIVAAFFEDCDQRIFRVEELIEALRKRNHAPLGPLRTQTPEEYAAPPHII